MITSVLASAAERLCGGRIVMTLEGGYDLAALASSVLATIAALGAPGQVPDAIPDGPGASLEALRRAVEFHTPGSPAA